MPAGARSAKLGSLPLGARLSPIGAFGVTALPVGSLPANAPYLRPMSALASRFSVTASVIRNRSDLASA
jgi:hypothetical protein